MELEGRSRRGLPALPRWLSRTPAGERGGWKTPLAPDLSAGNSGGGPPALAVMGLGVTFYPPEDGLEVLREVSFAVQPRSFTAVLGPSGSGKSTLLRVTAGLLQPTSGQVAFPASGGRPAVGYVFQDANLMPWRTALHNVTLPLELQGVPLADAEREAAELIALTGLAGFEDSWPRDLSGGMAQRVAIARALIQQPEILLLDEPFGALDALTRERMGEELLRIWQAQQKTVLLVTHSISEALLLSDRVLVLTPRPGQICLDVPVELPRPRADEMRYTAEFGRLAEAVRRALRIEAC